MVQITQIIFPFFFPFRSRPLIGGAGIAGISHSFPFRDISGIAGNLQTIAFIGARMNDLLGDALPMARDYRDVLKELNFINQRKEAI